jgi:IclR family transcriptional regulator, acetate operon repressor
MTTHIRVAERVADILSCFSLEQPALGVSEISRQLNLDKGTVCRILLTLEAKGLVTALDSSRKYSIGPKILQLAQVSLRKTNLGALALPHMKWLRDQTGETVSLSIRVGVNRVLIEQVESRYELRRTMELGKYYPLHAGSGGRVLLAHMPEDELDQFLSETQLTEFTDATVTDSARLREVLRQDRRDGFAVSHGEEIAWAAGVGAPVHDHTGFVVAALALQLVVSRFDPAKLDEYIGLVRETASRVSVSLGYRCE